MEAARRAGIAAAIKPETASNPQTDRIVIGSCRRRRVSTFHGRSSTSTVRCCPDQNWPFVRPDVEEVGKNKTISSLIHQILGSDAFKVVCAQKSYEERRMLPSYSRLFCALVCCRIPDVTVRNHCGGRIQTRAILAPDLPSDILRPPAANNSSALLGEIGFDRGSVWRSTGVLKQ